jgi:hypothetical protein
MKKRKRMTKKFLLPAFLLACAVGTAQAGSSTQTFTAPSTEVPFSVTFLADQFNMPGCTLTSVNITVTSDIVGSVNVINTSASAQTFSNATSSVPVTLTGPDSLGLNVTATTSGQSGSIAGRPGGPGTFTEVDLPGNTVTASVGTTLTGSSLTPYIGTGTKDLMFTFGAGSGTFGGSSSANGQVFFGGSATADATVTITYTWATVTVPEPSSMILAGIGVVGLAVFRRRLHHV